MHAFSHNEKRVQTPLSASLSSWCVGREDPSADRPPRSSTSQDCPFYLTGSRNTSTTDAVHLWKRALRHVLSTEPEAEVFAPCPAQGSLRLRQAIAAYLRAMRGMEVDPACIVVGAGAQELDGILTQLLGQHLTYAVEDPGYVRLTRIYQAMGCQVRHIGLDVAGPRMDELEASCAHVLHLMPSHQFPTGRVTSIARRYELLAWAAASTCPDANAAAGAKTIQPTC